MPAEQHEMPVKATGAKRVFRALWYSLEGIGSSLKHEAAFRQEMILMGLLLPVAFFVPVSWTAKALLIGSLFLVLIVELLNSGIEWAIDYISLKNHPFAKRAKDMGSAAVFLSLLNCATMWCLILLEAFNTP